MKSFLGGADAFIERCIGEETLLLWSLLVEIHKLTGDGIYEDLGEEASLFQAKLN